MRNNYKQLAVFEYSTEAQLIKSKLESENIRTMLMDEKTIDSDPLISQAIGGVKLLVHNDDLDNAIVIYNRVREYVKDEYGNDMICPNCSSNKILISDLERKNLFYMLFPFFESKKYICNVCKTVFK